MRKLIASTAVLSVAEVVTTVLTVVQTRYLAGTVGPAGFGVFGLLVAFFRLVSAYGTTWTSTSTTRWIARHMDEGHPERASQIWSLSLALTAVIIVPVAIVLALFAGPVTRAAFGGAVSREAFLIYTVVVCLTALRSTLTAAIRGLVRTNWLALLQLGGGALQLASVILFVAAFGLTGWFLGLLAPAAAVVIVAMILVVRHSPLRLVRPALRGSVPGQFLQYSGVDFGLTLVITAGDYAQRLIILHALGLEAVGLLHAALTLVLYLDITNRAAMTYLLPAMAGGSREEVFRHVEEFTRLALNVSTGLAVGTVLFGALATQVLLGPRFAPLGDSLPYFAVYFLITALHNPSATAVLAMAHLRVHAIAAIATITVSTALIFALVGSLGFTAIPVAMIGGQIAGFAIRFVDVQRLGLRLSARAWSLHAVALVATSAALALRDAGFLVRAAVLAVTAVVLLWYAVGALRSPAERPA